MPEETQIPMTPDLWTVWFFRFVQILGVLGVVNELVIRASPRDIAIFACLAMISGALGIERFLQWKSDR